MNSKKRKLNQNGKVQFRLTALLTLIAAALILITILTKSPSFESAFNSFIGNGIYNTFFMNGKGSNETEISMRLLKKESGPVIEKEIVDLFSPVIYSQNAILIRLSDMAVIYEKNSTQVNFPASLTKVMAALVAIDYMTDYNQLVLITEENINYTVEENASVAGFLSGEEIKAKDLLYGSLIASGADASIAISQIVTGIDDIHKAEEAFVILMNKKAVSMGLTDTHFMNSTGLHDPKHYTTAYEMAQIFAAAVKTPLLRDILITKKYTISPTNKHPSGLTFKSTVESSFKKAKLDMGFVSGGKTGYTPEARLCLATLATLETGNGPEDFILVTLSAGDGTYDTQWHVIDAYEVFNMKEELRKAEEETESSAAETENVTTAHVTSPPVTTSLRDDNR